MMLNFVISPIGLRVFSNRHPGPFEFFVACGGGGGGAGDSRGKMFDAGARTQTRVNDRVTNTRGLLYKTMPRRTNMETAGWADAQSPKVSFFFYKG